MKKILFALAIMPLLVMGCSSDDDDKLPAIDFDYSIQMLYGQWRATSVKVTEGFVIDLTNSQVEKEIPPTYVTFEKGGAFTGKGLLGDGKGGDRKGTYTTKDKTITLKSDVTLAFEMTSLASKTAEIKVDATAFGIEVPEGIESVTVVLTKQ